MEAWDGFLYVLDEFCATVANAEKEKIALKARNWIIEQGFINPDPPPKERRRKK